MSETELQFRTAAFGGFQKQDVLNYIESSVQEHREKLAELTRQADEVRRENDALREELSQARQKSGDDGEHARRLEGELAQSRKEAEDLRARLTEAEGKLAQAAPAAAAYQQVKERTAGIELEAHCRAQAVQAEAEERIRQAHRELEEWLGKVRKDYGGLRADMDAAVTQAHSELERARAALEAVSHRFAVQDERLEKLAQTCAGEHRAPDPLPLDQDK